MEEVIKIKDSNRIRWVDIAKGIAIIAIICGHQGLDNVNRVVFTFHIPMFYMLAGYFLKKKDDKEIIKSKARRLLLPYGVTCLAVAAGSVIVGQILGNTGKMETFFKLIGAGLYGAGDNWHEPFEITSIGAIWYLLALFFAYIIVNYFLEKKYDYVYIGIIAYIGWATFNKTNFWWPLSIQAGMLAAMYVYLGYQVRRNGILEKKLPVWIPIGMLIVWIWGIRYFNGFWLVHNYLGNGLIDIVVSICACYIVVLLSKLISKGEILSRILQFYGKNSLLILCIHIVEIKIIPWYLLKERIAGMYSITAEENTVILLFIKLAFCTVLALVISKIGFINQIFSPKTKINSNTKSKTKGSEIEHN